MCQLRDLEQQSPDASHLLSVLAFFDSESIPIEMLTIGAKAMSESQRPPSHAQVKRQPFVLMQTGKLLRQGGTTKAQTNQLHTSSVVPPTSAALLAVIQSPIDLRKAITHLQNLSLVAYQHDAESLTLRIHDLIQLVVLEKTRKSHAHLELFKFAVGLACNAFIQIEDHSLPEWWPQCELLIPHIQSLTLQQAILK